MLHLFCLHIVGLIKLISAQKLTGHILHIDTWQLIVTFI